jgi:pimeloyl-ACP methyl ester carboxylesterase
LGTRGRSIVSRITTSDGAHIHYTDSRSAGPPVLFVGGWCMSTPWWREQTRALGGEYRVIAMDPRAYGESEKVPFGHRMARHAADVRDLLGTLDLQEVTAVGWSSGANVLLCHYELFGGERIARIAHVDQTPYCLNRAGWDLGFGTEEEAKAFLRGFGADQAAAANGLIDAMLVEPPSGEDRKWMVEEMLKTPSDLALRFEWDHINADWRDVVPTVRLPVLVLTGRKSRIFPPSSGEWLARHFPDARHVVFEESGHCPFLEEPEKFNDELKAFIG